MPDLDHDVDPGPVTPQMTLVEIMSQWRSSEEIFKAYESHAGTCLRCHALYNTVEEVARKYNLDLTKLLADLNALARSLDRPAGCPDLIGRKNCTEIVRIKPVKNFTMA